MNEPKAHYSELPDGIANITIPLTIESMITAVRDARQTNTGMIRLNYTDGTQEEADCSEMNMVAEKSFFKIVDRVQGKREIEA